MADLEFKLKAIIEDGFDEIGDKKVSKEIIEDVMNSQLPQTFVVFDFEETEKDNEFIFNIQSPYNFKNSEDAEEFFDTFVSPLVVYDLEFII